MWSDEHGDVEDGRTDEQLYAAQLELSSLALASDREATVHLVRVSVRVRARVRVREG